MDRASTPLDRLFDGLTPGTVGSLEGAVNSRAGRAKPAGFLIANRARVAGMFSSARSIDLQMGLMRVIQRALTKQQILKHEFFNGHSVLMVSGRRMGKEQARECLLDYNNAASKHIIGCRLEALSSTFKDIRLSKGILFLNDDSIRIYGEGHAIVIFYRSILSVSSADSRRLTINAHENRMVAHLIRRGRGAAETPELYLVGPGAEDHTTGRG